MPEASDAGATLGPIPTLPVFLKLRGRRVVLAGGGQPAVWKAEVLCAAGAYVEIIADDVYAGLEALARTLGDSALRLIRRPWAPEDLPGAAVALGAIEDEAEAIRFRAAAVSAGVPVNVIDKPNLCDFQFGTLVDRSPLLLAISTDGAAPVFGQAIRTRVEALLPEGLRRWAEAATVWRPLAQARHLSFRQRRRFWEEFADRALRFADRTPSPADLAACFAHVDRVEPSRPGRVTLVGCGPGDLDSITFGAARALQAADAILVDGDVGAEIINLGRREAPKERTEGIDAISRVATLAVPGAQIVWLGTGNATSDQPWAVRASLLARLGIEVARLPGVNRSPGGKDHPEDASLPDRRAPSA